MYGCEALSCWALIHMQIYARTRMLVRPRSTVFWMKIMNFIIIISSSSSGSSSSFRFDNHSIVGPFLWINWRKLFNCVILENESLLRLAVYCRQHRKKCSENALPGIGFSLGSTPKIGNFRLSKFYRAKTEIHTHSMLSR